MKKLFMAIPVLVAVGLVFMIQVWPSGNRGQAASEPRVISVLGVAQVQGEEVFVHITVLVPGGQDERAVADAVLREQGARRAGPGDLHSANFETTGLVWDEFFDADPGNNFVTQHYNPANDPTGGNGESALQNTHATWTDVSTSSFAFQYGGQTNRCPSLVKECPGNQKFDDLNDVAWLDLGRCNFFRCTLGVTWYSTSIDEADMALNTKFNWTVDCTRPNGSPYDAQTVFLHENGHVVGVGHSNDPNALMYPFYGGAMCALGQDDIDGISSLYPAGGATPEPTATPADTPTPVPTATEGPAATATPTATPGDGITLTASGHKARGLQKADLEWSGAGSTNVDVYRDGSPITTTENDGFHTDNIDQRGRGTYTYKLCEQGTTTCSNEATVSFN